MTGPRHAPPSLRRTLVALLPLLVVLLGLAATTIVVQSTHNATRRAQEQRFDAETDQIFDSFEDNFERIASVPELLYGTLIRDRNGASLEEVNSRVSGYTSTLAAPTLFGVAWADTVPYLPQGSLALDAKRIPSDLPADAVVVTYGFPENNMKVALGINARALPEIDTGIDLALSQGSPALSPPFIFPAMYPEQVGFADRMSMYIVPFFDTTKPGNPLRGVAAPIFSFDDMPTTISGAMGTRYAVSVTSQGWEPATNGLNPDDGGASTHRTLFLGTVPWEIVVTETSQITYGEVDSTNDILRIGLTLTGAAAAIVWMMTRLDRRTQRQIKQATADLSHRASHDLLTGLVNRSTLMHSVDAAIATGKPLGVVFLDLDNFKTVNDTYGHRFGDAVLVEVAARIRRNTRTIDVVGRMGGDEFVIVVPDVTIEVLTELGERLIHAIHEPMEFEGIEVLPSASIGVSLHQGGGDADSLIRDADIAMYTAKANGRNGLSVFVASRHSEMTRREVAERFRDAIHDYQIELVYQPIVSLATHHVAGVEALARWTDTELGAISPQQFVELAHNLGALPLLTERIIERAFQDHSMWKHHLGEACPWISINLSLGQLADRSFAETVERYLVEYRVDPSMLVFEVAEDAAMGELSATLRQLGAIRRLGCKVAIDDFGSGYSNLLHLRQLPLSQLKLAPEMIAHLEDETDVHLLKAVRALGVAMGFEVIAKGIELPGQESALQMLEFQFGQGWLFGRAASADHILRLIEMTREPVMSTN